MFSPVARVVLVVALVIAGVYQLSIGRISGWLLIVAAAGFAYGYFRYGAVWAAWRALKAGKPSRAKSLVSTVRYPGLLARQHLAYYHFTQGLLSMQDETFDVAADHLDQAAKGALRTTNDRSIALLTLAELKARAGEKEVAHEYLDKARSTPHNPELDEAFKKVESLVRDAS